MDYLTEKRITGHLKTVPDHFIVREAHPLRFHEALTVGPESDFTPEELNSTQDRSAGITLFTCIKRGLTTWAAQDWIASEISKQLGRRVRPEQIRDSGLKDRWAVTAQTMSITGVSPEELRQCDFNFRRPHNAHFLIKDIRAGVRPVNRGQHSFNRFEITALVDLPEAQLRAYIEPLMERLSKEQMRIPNAFGRQRLGRRQNLHVVGKTLVGGGFTANDAPPFGSNIEAAIYLFLFDCSGNEQPRTRQLREEMKRCWLYDFPGMRRMLEKHYRLGNMNIEYDLVCRLANTSRYKGDFAKVLTETSRCNLWVGAWQSYWFNQCLAREIGFRDWDLHIPLLKDTECARKYYSRHNCHEAIADLNKAEPLVRKQFLTPWNSSRRPNDKGPHRPAFIEVKNFSSQCSDGTWKVGFDLRSGAYATNVLGLFLDIAEPDDATFSTDPN